MAKIKLTGFQYFLVGSQLVVMFFASVFIGYWVDLKNNSSPIFLISGIAIGILSFFILLRRLQKAVQRDAKRNQKLKK